MVWLFTCSFGFKLFVVVVVCWFADLRLLLLFVLVYYNSIVLNFILVFGYY